MGVDFVVIGILMLLVSFALRDLFRSACTLGGFFMVVAGFMVLKRGVEDLRKPKVPPHSLA